MQRCITPQRRSSVCPFRIDLSQHSCSTAEWIYELWSHESSTPPSGVGHCQGQDICLLVICSLLGLADKLRSQASQISGSLSSKSLNTLGNRQLWKETLAVPSLCKGTGGWWNSGTGPDMVLKRLLYLRIQLCRPVFHASGKFSTMEQMVNQEWFDGDEKQNMAHIKHDSDCRIHQQDGYEDK